MDPYNYTQGFQDPMVAFRNSLVMGSEIQQQRALSAKAQAVAARQAEVKAAFERLRQLGATAKDYMDLAMVLPKDESEALRESFKMLRDEEQKSALADSAQIFSAFKSGRTDLAVQLIRRQAQAERNSGNEQGANLAEEWAKMAEDGDAGAQAVSDLFGFTIAQMPGGDKAIEGALKFEADRRIAAEQPILMAQKRAELSKAKTDAARANVEYKYADKMARATLAKAETEAATARKTLETLGAQKEIELRALGLDVAVKEKTLETMGPLKQAELAQAQSDAEKAGIEAKYADREAAAGLAKMQAEAQLSGTAAGYAERQAAAGLSKAEADAARAAIDAKYAPQIAEAGLALDAANAKATQATTLLSEAQLPGAVAGSQRAKAIADVETRRQQLELDGLAAQLGLTEAQKNKAIIEGKKMSAEIAKILMETAAAEKFGGISPEKKFEQEEKLRKEYVSRTQSFSEMQQTYANIQASSVDASGAGDIALVTGFMRMLDPDSVVRESEFATARDTAGLLAKLQSMAKKVQDGQFLSPQQRQDFAYLAGQYMKAAETHESRVRKDLGAVVQSYGLSADNVFGTSIQPSDITALRAYLKQNNPGSETKIDGMSEEQLAAAFPKGYAAYRAQSAKQSTMVEVDY